MTLSLFVVRRFININGRLLPAEDATVPAEDRSFRYGYGLFETMLALNGVIRHEDLHWARLLSGLALLQFELPVRFADNLRHETQRCMVKHGMSGAMRIRLQVTPGAGGYFDAAAWRPFFIIECWPLPDFTTALNDNGLVLGIAEARKEPGPYSGCKSTSALCYSMAARQAKASGWNDALLCNAAGHIVESSIANVFVQHEGRVLTPPLSDGCIDGVMRKVLLTRLSEAGIPVAEESVSTILLHSVEGVILTNSIRGIRWVKAVDGLQFSPDFARKTLPLLT